MTETKEKRLNHLKFVIIYDLLDRFNESNELGYHSR